MILSHLKKIVRTDILALSLIVLLFHLVCMGSVCSGAEVKIDCDQLLSKGGLNNIGSEGIMEIQKILEQRDYYTFKIDGIARGETRSALEKYCADSEMKDEVGLVYTLTEEDLEELTTQNEILQKLQELMSAEFKDKYELRQAVEGTIKEMTDQYSQYQSMIEIQAREKQDNDLKTYTLDEQSFKVLKEKIIPDEIIEKLKILQDVAYPNLKLFKQALKENKGLEGADQYESLILEKARKVHAFSDYKDSSIDWSGGSCGCVLEDLSGVVYGFYPFWLAGEEQTIDFSVLTRIGYYALSFDENGDLDETLPWEKKSGKKAAESLNIARKYRTKVDLVIYQNDWKIWSQHTKEKLIRNVVNLLTVELTDSFSRIKPYISFGSSSIQTVADGVTLYFDGYPEGEKYKNLFVDLIQELRTKLKELRKTYYLNVMLQSNEIAKGIYDSNTLSKIIPKSGKCEQDYEGQNYVDHFLVFIEEPTKETKKELRKDVEDLFTGIQRRTMLRKIIPIINPLITRAGHNEQQREADLKQLKDDLIYFEDNFGGVGFWVLPTKKGGRADFITCTKAIFLSDKTEAMKDPTRADDINTYLTKFYQKDGAKPLSGYHNFVTLHRWGFRILFDILLAIIAVYALLSAFICWLRDLFMKFFWWFIGVVLLFIGTFFSLLYCDPSWKNIAEGNLILFLFFLVIVVIAILGYVKKSRQGELP